MNRCVTLMVLVLVAFGMARPVAALPVAYVAVGTYDEQVHQINTIEKNANGNALVSTSSLTDLASFKPNVLAAFNAGMGGVVNFDLPNSGTSSVVNNNEGFTASFAGGTKLLPVTMNNATSSSTPNNQLNHTTFSTLRPISGSSTDSKGLIASQSQTTAMRLTFGALTGSGVLPGEKLSQVGLTLLSRDSTAQNFRLDWFIDGETVTPISQTTVAMAAGQSLDDTFFSYVAPNGSGITSVRFNFDVGGSLTDKRLAIDDLGFITVPEPSTFILAGLAGLGVCLARRRKVLS